MRAPQIRRWEHLWQGDAVDYRVLRVQRVGRRSPRTGGDRDFVILRAGSWVNVIALTAAGEVVLVWQYRHGIEEVTLEVPGGIVDDGEDPAAAAARELLEETGFAGGPPELLGVVHPNPALLDNRCFSYLIRDARPVSEPHPDPGEDIEVATAPLAQIPDLIRQGLISHSLVVAAFFQLQLAHGAE